jgi:dTDP-4-dehydrorhamnose reductase
MTGGDAQGEAVTLKSAKTGLLVFGASGQIGHELCRAAQPSGVVLTGLGKAEVDITRPDDVREAVGESRPAVVVNAAAYTRVDLAESEPAAAFAVNRDGAGHVAEACRETGAALIHLSTDYVFDGTKPTAYDEDDAVNPLGVYGKSKEAGERAVRDAADRHVILRTSWVFGAKGPNFVKAMLRAAGEGVELRVVDDQFGCPTPAMQVAEAILAMAPAVAGGKSGTFHFSAAGRTSWHGFAQEIFALRREITGQPPPPLRPVATADRPAAAPRPANSELDCARLTATFAIAQRSWRQGLVDVLNELLKV